MYSQFYVFLLATLLVFCFLIPKHLFIIFVFLNIKAVCLIDTKLLISTSSIRPELIELKVIKSMKLS